MRYKYIYNENFIMWTYVTERVNWHTLDTESKRIAVCLPFRVDGDAGIATGVLSSHLLQHEALVDQYEPSRHVMAQQSSLSISQNDLWLSGLHVYSSYKVFLKCTVRKLAFNLKYYWDQII